MRVLLDACVPERLRLSLQPALEVETARFAGVHHLLDRDLLEAIEGRFDVLVTCDRGLAQQQSIDKRNLAVVVLRAPTNRLADLTRLVPSLLAAIADIEAGEVRTVTAD
jgi:predicted nuclease of predicted toxin-antitoxin system